MRDAVRFAQNFSLHRPYEIPRMGSAPASGDDPYGRRGHRPGTADLGDCEDFRNGDQPGAANSNSADSLLWPDRRSQRSLKSGRCGHAGHLGF